MRYCDSGSERVAFVMYDDSRPARALSDAVKSVVDICDSRKDSLCGREEQQIETVSVMKGYKGSKQRWASEVLWPSRSRQ